MNPHGELIGYVTMPLSGVKIPVYSCDQERAKDHPEFARDVPQIFFDGARITVSFFDSSKYLLSIAEQFAKPVLPPIEPLEVPVKRQRGQRFGTNKFYGVFRKGRR